MTLFRGLDFDAFWLLGLVNRQDHFQLAILIRRGNFIRVNLLVKGDRAYKGAPANFAHLPAPLLLFPLLVAGVLGFDSESVVAQCQLNILRLDTWKLSLHFVALLSFTYIYGQCSSLANSTPERTHKALLKQAIHGIVEANSFTERIVTCDICHIQPPDCIDF